MIDLEMLIRWGLDPVSIEGMETELSAVGGVSLGRVVRVDRDRATVVSSAGEVVARFDDLPVTGDWVLIRDRGGDDPPWEIQRQMPRSTEVVRLISSERFNAAEQGRPQVVAANVDVIGCVSPLDRDVKAARIEREMVIAWDSGARPVIVLTKADLIADVESILDELLRELPGVEIVATSAKTGLGIGQLTELVRPNKTLAFLGASGAGKSSLVNALIGSEVIEVSEVRDADKRGRHTTVTRQLVALETGGVLMDTPGLRSIGLWNADEGLAATFPDIVDLANGCKFRDCSHRTEPGCAVTAAVGGGTLSAQRLDRYLALADEIGRVEERLQLEAKERRQRAARQASKEKRSQQKRR